MVRKLKFHEQKLLKKVDFISWKIDNNLHEVKIMRKYHIEKRDDYTLYNKLSRDIRFAAKKISELEPSPFRDDCSARLLQKLYALGLIGTRSNLELSSKVSASSFCRRRLPFIMVKQKMAESLSTAVKFIKHGHVRVGVELVKDPALIITRNMEDFITWIDSSAIRKHVLEYNDQRDDFDNA